MLNILGQRGRNPVRIDRVIVQSLWLKENLMRGFIGKANDLILNRRAIARADALNMTTVHGRAVEVVANDLVRRLIRVGDPTGDLARERCLGQK